MENKLHNEVLDLIPAYALNSLDTIEAELVGRHLADCVYCREELAAYQAVVDVIPLAVPDVAPSPELKERLMTRISSKPAAVTPEPRQTLWTVIGGSFQNLLTGPRWRPVALLVILVLLASNIVILLQAIGLADDKSDWQQIALAATEFAPGAEGVIYLSIDGRNGTLIVDGLPPLNPEQQYQLWLIANGQRESGGVFSVDNDGYRSIQVESDGPIDEFEAFGITVEPAGGSPGPTGQRVLGYNL